MVRRRFTVRFCKGALQFEAYNSNLLSTRIGSFAAFAQPNGGPSYSRPPGRYVRAAVVCGPAAVCRSVRRPGREMPPASLVTLRVCRAGSHGVRERSDRLFTGSCVAGTDRTPRCAAYAPPRAGCRRPARIRMGGCRHAADSASLTSSRTVRSRKSATRSQRPLRAST
jgi:hypothetical protein